MPSTGTPSSKIAGSSCGAPSSYTLDGPPESTMPDGFLAATSAAVTVCGTISRVDARLAHAAGDQLRVLRAEVDDEHGPDGLAVSAAQDVGEAASVLI